MAERQYETCCLCSNRTGRAGQGEDSIYFGEIGPWCEECATTIRDGIESDLQQQLAASEARCQKYRYALISIESDANMAVLQTESQRGDR